KLETTPLGPSSMILKLEDRRRLLIHVASSGGAMQKRHDALAFVFQMLHEIGEPADRVVLIANTHVERRPSERPDPLEPDALDLIARLGATVVPSAVVFA